MTSTRAFSSVDECLTALARGAGTFDEPDVDGLAHSLQCGAILRTEHPADLELAVAGLLHDIADAVTPDDHRDHDRRGADFVRPLLGDRVAHLVGAHVLAKRYLVRTDPAYQSELSDRSVETLVLQGGVLDDAELRALDRDPELVSILALRRADERAKVPGARVAGIDSWRDALATLARA